MFIQSRSLPAESYQRRDGAFRDASAGSGAGWVGSSASGAVANATSWDGSCIGNARFGTGIDAAQGDIGDWRDLFVTGIDHEMISVEHLSGLA